MTLFGQKLTFMQQKPTSLKKENCRGTPKVRLFLAHGFIDLCVWWRPLPFCAPMLCFSLVYFYINGVTMTTNLFFYIFLFETTEKSPVSSHI